MNSTDSNSGKFPGDFVWGSATAAYQIEGAIREDGKGESIWDRFCTVPGAINGGQTGEMACDHYHLWPRDVEMMRDLGLQAYRFSVSWPRIFPEGKGQVNQPGLDFYDRLVDGLLEAGIAPYVTLYHWDLPQALQDKGGWANPETASAFARYAEVVAQRLGDRVPAWITHNEPAVAAFHGHLTGEHAPGIRDIRTAYRAAHYILLSHGLATQALRSVQPGSKVGITLNLIPAYPATAAPEDEAAAYRNDGFQNRWFLDPVFHGRYPEDVLDVLGNDAPPTHYGDMATIAQPIDFLGINYYNRAVIQYNPAKAPFHFEQIQPKDAEYTDMGWEVYPDGLRGVLERLHNSYPAKEYYITENGAAVPDAVSADGAVHDEQRLAYLESHFGAIQQAMAAGVPLKGYFVWSLMDNFEWAFGFGKRFGIVYVDYATQKRIPKDSALWYRDWIGRNK